MSAAIMSADVMFMPDALAWQAKSACYLYEVIKIMKNNVILHEKLVF
jgi:hypothetical protein